MSSALGVPICKSILQNQDPANCSTAKYLIWCGHPGMYVYDDWIPNFSVLLIWPASGVMVFSRKVFACLPSSIYDMDFLKKAGLGTQFTHLAFALKLALLSSMYIISPPEMIVACIST